MAQAETPGLPDQLGRATSRRRALAEAMAELEQIVAGPASAGAWLDRVEVGMAELRAALDAHIEEVEAPGGLLAEIEHVAPGLAPQTEDLRRDHMALLGAWLRAEAGVRAARDAGHEALATVRRRIVTLIGRLTIHRQAGSDLVFEAYNVDIGAGD